MTQSIYDRIRNEGYRDGSSQAGQVTYDEAYVRGQEQAWASEPSRFRWFTFGALIVVILDCVFR